MTVTYLRCEDMYDLASPDTKILLTAEREDSPVNPGWLLTFKTEPYKVRLTDAGVVEWVEP